MRKQFILIAAIISILVGNSSLKAQERAQLNVCHVRLCTYDPLGTIAVSANEECPNIPPNILIDSFLRVKPISLEVPAMAEPFELAHIKITAPPELIDIANQQGEMPFLPPSPDLLWPGQLLGQQNECLLFQSPQPIPLEPNLPLQLPLAESDFHVDSFFDVFFEVELRVELLDPNFNPIPIEVELNLIPEPLVSAIDVCRYRVCEYENGQQIVLPFIPGIDCPSFLGNPTNVLINSYIRTIFKTIDILEVPGPLQIGGFQMIPPPELIDEANQLGLPGVFLEPQLPMIWDFQPWQNGGVLYLPPQPIGVDPSNLPLQLESDPGQPLFVVDSFFDVFVELNINCEIVDVELQPIPGIAEFETVLLGDTNCDGQVNLLDVQSFIDILSAGKYNVKADMNGDGAVNLLDVDGFIFALSN